MLKGKALKDFEAFYKKNKFNEVELGNNEYCDIDLEEFYHMKSAFQQGILLEFFRERGINIILDIRSVGDWEFEHFYTIYDINNKNMSTSELFTDYPTAFTHAIEKACELYEKGE